ncbi:MAG TPA: hypothetical protein VMH87_17190 [Pseudomonadales bacterium]|nr:hypothetical protein [Pseudomonadales bacterium]
MNPRILERLVYALVIVLSLIALGLVALAPGFMDTQVVYQGF